MKMKSIKHILSLKRILPVCAGSLFIILSSFFNSTQAQINSYFDRPKVAVVLSGGGAKGVAHISALKAIEEAGLPIDMICGTSMGALIGGLYSIGWSTDELDSMVRHQNWSILLTDRVRSEDLDIDARALVNTYPLWHAFTLGSKKNEGAGFFRGVNIDFLFDDLLAGYHDSIDFNTLPIPFACVATDIVTNTEIDFHSGYLKEAMRASMSIPGVFAPVRKGNMLLVDGGMRNNYPADLARQMGADIIIGVAVLDDTLTADDITGPAELVMQIIDINCKNKIKENLEMSDILIKVDVDGYSAASFTAAAIDTLLRRGAEEAAKHRDELLQLRRDLESKRSKWNTHRYSSQPSAAINTMDQTRDTKLTAPKQILNSPMAGVAFRFDNEETGALQLGARLPFVWHVPMEVSTRLRLGKRLQFHLEHKFYPSGITSPSLSYTYHRNDIDIYSNGVRSFNIKYAQHTVELTPLNSRFRLYKFCAGLRFDYYNYYDPILSAITSAITLEDQRYFSYFFQSFLNTENHWYYPTSGNFFLVKFAYHTDNFATYNGRPGIPEVSVHWRFNITPVKNYTIQPGIFSRLFFDNDIPVTFINVLGTRQHIVEQQIAFPGVHSIVMASNYLVGAHMNFQLTLGEKSFILIRTAAARHVDKIVDFIKPNMDFTSSEFIYGISAGYAYNTFLGPIEAHLGYSTLAPGINFYLNIGHSF